MPEGFTDAEQGEMLVYDDERCYAPGAEVASRIEKTGRMRINTVF